MEGTHALVQVLVISIIMTGAVAQNSTLAPNTTEPTNETTIEVTLESTNTPTLLGTSEQPTDPAETQTTMKTQASRQTTATVQTRATGEPTEALQTTAKGATTAAPAFIQFQCSIRIVEIGGIKANFTDAYTNEASTEYEELSEDVCLAVGVILEAGDYGNDLLDCAVTGFTEGSIVAAFNVNMRGTTEATASILADALVTGFKDSNDANVTHLSVDTETIEVTAPETEPEPTGLSVGAIVGIAVGSFVGLILIIVVIVLLAKCCTGSSSKVTTVEDGGELRPTPIETDKGQDNTLATAE